MVKSPGSPLAGSRELALGRRERSDFILVAQGARGSPLDSAAFVISRHHGKGDQCPSANIQESQPPAFELHPDMRYSFARGGRGLDAYAELLRILKWHKARKAWWGTIESHCGEVLKQRTVR
jgi:hypothetical protein